MKPHYKRPPTVVDLKKKNDLQLLIDFLNASGSDELQREMRELLTDLITRPDPKVIGRPLSRGGNSAMLSSYCMRLDRLVGKINFVLKAELRIVLGTEKVWQDHYTMERFPLRSEATWVSRGMGRVSNPDYIPHIRSGKGWGIIRTPWGKVMVVGGLPPHPKQPMSKREHWYRVIAESLLLGKFSLLRLCRPKLSEMGEDKQGPSNKECNMIFLTSKLKKPFCSPKCERAWNTSYRVEKHRRRNRSAEKDKARAVLSWLASRIRTVKVEDPFDLIYESPELVRLKDHLGVLWEDFEPTVEEIYGKDTDFNVMVKKLNPRVMKKLSVYNPSASNHEPTAD